MTKPRGRSHTTLTVTATTIVKILRKIPGIKMIAPGEIAGTRAASQRITVTYTTSGIQLLIAGNGIQKISVHTENEAVNTHILRALQQNKQLQSFTVAERLRKPGT